MSDAKRTFKIGEAEGKAVWRDQSGILHLCEGAQLVSSDRGTFCMWTLCGSADVPNEKMWIKRSEDVVDCEACQQIDGHVMPYSGSMEAKW